MLSDRRWERSIWIGGRWVSDRCVALPVVAPANGDLLATAGEPNASAVGDAVAEAVDAGYAWSRQPPTERAEVLARAGSLLLQHAEEIVWWLVRESGSVRHRAESSVRLAAARFSAAATTAEQAAAEVVLASSSAGGHSVARRVPLGVVGIITPWNSPLVIAVRALAPALAAGNAVVLKPDPHTPVSGGVVLAALLHEAGLPGGVLQVLPGGVAVGEALVSDPRLGKVSFTGSTRAGRRVAALAGEALVSVGLELGGNNPSIVLDDADLRRAVEAGVRGSFGHQGQVCMATGRHLVHRSVASEYVSALAERAKHLRVGDPASEDVDLGPLISEMQANRVEHIVTGTVAGGAGVRCGARREGNFYWPTVLEGVDRTMPAFTEEIFGPVAPVTVVANDDEALELAAATPYGLVASVFTADPGRGRAMLEQLRTGVGHVNDVTVKSDPTAPFGGMGWSGNGTRYGALSDTDEFTTWRWLTECGDERPSGTDAPPSASSGMGAGNGGNEGGVR